MSKVQFIEKYQERLLWLAMRGLVLDTDDRPKGPLGAGTYALTIPDKVKTLLSDMYDTVTEKASDDRSSNSTVPSQQAGRPGVPVNAANRPGPGRAQ